MNDKPNILRFPRNYQCPSDSAAEYDDEHDDFEAWEAYAELLESGDYPGLVAYCERDVARHPEDLHAQERLGEAYVLNGQFEKAIQAMGDIHRELPDIEAFQHVILDALFALNKTEDDYEWISAPRVLKLGKSVRDTCYEFLRPKRKPRVVADLEIELMMDGYLTFSCEALLGTLVADDRFVVQHTGAPQLAEVRVRRKREGKSG